MSLSRMQLEPWLRGKYGRSKKGGTYKYYKNQRNRWLRRRMKDPEFIPKLNEYSGWEF